MISDAMGALIDINTFIVYRLSAAVDVCHSLCGPIAATTTTTTTQTKSLFTLKAAAGLVAVVVAVVHAVAPVAAGHASAVEAGEGVGAALQRGGLVGGVLQAGLLVGRQPHAVGTATHAARVRRREAEVAAVPVGVGRPVAEVGT